MSSSSRRRAETPTDDGARIDKSLGILTAAFVKMLQEAPDKTLDLKVRIVSAPIIALKFPLAVIFRIPTELCLSSSCCVLFFVCSARMALL